MPAEVLVDSERDGGKTMGQPRSDGDREVSSAFLSALIDYLERAGGPDLVNAVATVAGGRRSLAEMRGTRWGSRDEVLAVAEAAARLTGDPDIGRRAGEELGRASLADPAMRAHFLSLGHPAGAVDSAVDFAHKMARGRTYEIVSRGPGSCVVEGRYDEPELGHPFFCGLAIGFWPVLASLFGAVGTGLHPSCQCRGDAVCRFEIRWDAGASADRTEIDEAHAELRRRIDTFEEMQAVAEDLARAADLPSLAERILDAVEGIYPAPQLLVAIHARKGKPPVLASRGLAETAARSIAEDLLNGRRPRRAAVSAAPLGSFGVLAAISPEAPAGSDAPSRIMEAFARHAGARVEAVLSRQLAEESRQTASALLLLAGSLAETTTESEVSQCLARSIPQLVGADHSAVLRWEPDRCLLRTVAYVGPPGRAPFWNFGISQVPSLYEMAARPSPFVLNRANAPDYIAKAMANWDEQLDVIVPLVEQGDFLGFVCAGYRDEIGLDRESAFARLQGAADLAATAFTKGRLLEEIRHQALHDDLTGLPNRVLLEDRVRQGLREARRHRRRLALLFLDLDRFKNVNDSMGHKFGDSLLQAAAQRISGSLRESDIFARMGGDEFVIVLHDIQEADAATLVATKLLEVMRRPFDIAGRTLYVSASVGVAVYPDDGTDYGALLQAADSSMYAAKDAGRNTVSRREPGAGMSEGRHRLSLETELHRAIDTDQIQVVFQPQVAMADLKLLAVEALVRWEHPRLGQLAPSEFLGLAEECGLMPRLDRAVRRLALRQARSWHREIGPLVVAVNLGAQSIRRAELLQEIAADIVDSGVDPTAIEVELTEGMVGDDDLKPVVEGLAGMGLRVAIDDFGTGASVFARLQRLPVHTLKIDRSLVQAGQDRRDSSILAAIVAMSHSLGLHVVAEGVENAVQAGHLRRSGCDSGQGYLFGRPGPAEDIEKMMYFQLTNLDRPAFVPDPRSRPSRRARLQGTS